MGPRERGLRFVASGAFFVVGATVWHGPVGRGVLFFLGTCALLAAITGYGPLYPYISRLNPNKRDKL